MGSVGAFARALPVGILPAMPGRGHRRSAARAIAAMCAAAAVVGLAAAGCDSHSRPQAVDDPTSPAPAATLAPPSTSTQATSSSSTESSPTDPTASGFPSATAQIPEAIQVVRAFFDGLNYEIDHEGDESRVAAVFSTDCANCVSSVSKIHDLFAGNHSLHGGHYRVVSINRSYATDQDHVAIEIIDSAESGEQVDANGNVIRHFPGASPTRLVFYVTVSSTPPKIGAYFIADQS